MYAGDGVRIAGGDESRIVDCTIRQLGNYGVVIDGGTNHTVDGCNIYETGDGGISVTGGDRKTLTAAGHVAENNHIHHIARWSRCYAPAILISGVGNRASNNLIHDPPHCAILFGGNEHVIELQRDSPRLPGDGRRGRDLHRPRLDLSAATSSATTSSTTPAASAWARWASTWTIASAAR